MAVDFKEKNSNAPHTKRDIKHSFDHKRKTKSSYNYECVVIKQVNVK